MNVLIIGSGGREHALAWKIAQGKQLKNLYCMPGNPGTKAIATNLPGDIKDFRAIEEQILAHDINLMIVGPENPLVDGIRDYFAQTQPNLLIVGPDKKGAALEGSKEFAKEFMMRHNIPTAQYRTFTAETEKDAFLYIDAIKPPYVLKADGLAAGKGVIITSDMEEAKLELAEMFRGKFGAASGKVVIEQYLDGIELSVFVLTDGKDYMVLPEAKDYKRIGEHDQGLNTGGMGSVSPVPFANQVFMTKVKSRIIEPTISGLRAEKIDYRGFIFIGLMNCHGEPYIIEYNVRMGDPETESVMPRIKSDLLRHLTAAAKCELGTEKIEISSDTAVTVFAVSGGYPEHYGKGYPICGLDEASKECIVYHAGTKEGNGQILTSGGRVLAVTALGKDIQCARKKAYKALSNISYDKIYYRKDIADDLINYKVEQ